MSDAVQVRLCGAERAGEIHRLTQLAFAPYAALDPPSGAVAESLEVVTADLALGGGALARPGGDGTAVGCLRWRLNDDGTFYVKRLAVDPGWQGRGVGRTLVRWVCGEARARDLTAVTVGVRVALPGNLAFFRGLGFEVVGEHSHDGYARTTWLSLRQDL